MRDDPLLVPAEVNAIGRLHRCIEGMMGFCQLREDYLVIGIL